MESETTSLRDEVHGLRADMTTGFERVEARVERLEDKFGRLEDNFERLERRMEALNTDTRQHADALNADTIRAMEVLHVQTNQKVDEKFNQVLVLHEEVLSRIKALGDGGS